MSMTVLSGHVSAETAYLVDDYPYGFRLRCKIRYWLEYQPRKGFRFWSQTTNPKKAGEVWNKPKASTYCRFGGVMLLDDKGHVSWTGLTEYSEVARCVDFNQKFGHTMPKAGADFLRMWISRKLAFEQAKLNGAVRSTVTCTNYGSVLAPGFGTPVEPPKVTTRVLESEFTAEELQAMGETLRTPENAASQIAKFARTEVA